MTIRPFTLLLPALAAAAMAAVAAAAATTGGERVSTARAARAEATAWARNGSAGLVRARGNQTRRGGGTYAATSTAGGKGRARGRARVGAVSLFGGLVRAASVRVDATAAGASRSTRGRVRSLVVAGEGRGSPGSARTFAIDGGYGRVSVLRRRGAGITGLAVRLTRDYKGHRAGSTARIAFASAGARDGTRRPRARDDRPRAGARNGGRDDSRAGSDHDAGREVGGGRRRRAPDVGARLTGRGYTFPVFGDSDYSDDWGAPRGVNSKHEGNDIFADTGTPVVAVTDGTLNRVGTKKISGNRLWLKSKRGDSFFYAHLSAFAHDARDRARVKSGDVLGFVGSTGDAEQTPPHLHFEVHPNDGKPVNPYPFLRAWESGRDVPPGAWLTRYGADPSSRPGALVVLEDHLER